MRRPLSLPDSTAQEQFHVVLVAPGDSLNVGAVARAMTNLGFVHLHLVAPPRYDPARAAITACWATDLLERAQIHDTLHAALEPMEQVVGFTARHGKNRPRHVLLPDWIDSIAEGPPARTALLFGAEDDGLRREHLAHCHWLVRIPSSVENPSFNLAQSVLLTLFELTRQHWPETARSTRQLPTSGNFYQLEALVDEVLTRCRFYKDGTPEPVPDMIKHLLRRTDPDSREMQILLGIFGKINRALAGKVPVAQPAGKEEGEG
ncbi:MAG: RNA methyltransferase [SAR324 cluster bacterium]|nr:RNA methyltransferase [SAR324 cluster bacterium]MCZ6629255.1 RNA methyltransferase [SAR324 cluster bacterium]MCZ6646212.1 RNA methyltransferase [SAR324 cluster bacterium]MCZ6843879.1 RNA methyltransferase [SAR324 cluster bacterium]